MSERMCVLHSGAVVVNVTVNGAGDAGGIRDAVTEAVSACIEEAVKPRASASPEPRFSIGDVVSLKSGGPRMTVESVSKSDDGSVTAHCSWFPLLSRDPALPAWDQDGTRYAATASHGVFAIDGLEP